MKLGPSIGRAPPIPSDMILERGLEATVAIAEDIKKKGRQGISVINLNFASKANNFYNQRMRKQPPCCLEF